MMDAASQERAVPPPAPVNMTQVAIVVRDLQATIEAYHETFGWGPWSIYELIEPIHHDTEVNGEPLHYSMLAAIAHVGAMDFEVIQPLGGHNPLNDFLESHGEGLHHILCRATDGDSAGFANVLRAHGSSVMMGGQIASATSYAYHDVPILKVLVEAVSGGASSGEFGPTRVWP